MLAASASPLPVAATARLAPGLLLAGAVAAAATAIACMPWLQAHGPTALTLAIAIGLAAGNLPPAALPDACAAGLDFARQRLLRAGIVLYGLRLTFQDIAHVGSPGWPSTHWCCAAPSGWRAGWAPACWACRAPPRC